jgi:hypothetical protein
MKCSTVPTAPQSTGFPRMDDAGQPATSRSATNADQQPQSVRVAAVIRIQTIRKWREEDEDHVRLPSLWKTHQHPARRLDGIPRLPKVLPDGVLVLRGQSVSDVQGASWRLRRLQARNRNARSPKDFAERMARAISNVRPGNRRCPSTFPGPPCCPVQIEPKKMSLMTEASPVQPGIRGRLADSPGRELRSPRPTSHSRTLHFPLSTSPSPRPPSPPRRARSFACRGFALTMRQATDRISDSSRVRLRTPCDACDRKGDEHGRGLSGLQLLPEGFRRPPTDKNPDGGPRVPGIVRKG